MPFQREVLEESKEWMIFWALDIKKHIESELYPPNRKGCYFCDFSPICEKAEGDRERIIEMNYVEREAHNLFAGKEKE